MANRTLIVSAVAAAAVSVCPAASGALLNLSLDPSPDITSGFLDVEYNAMSGAFGATGFALSIFDGMSSHTVTDGASSNGSFSLSAMIDSMGAASGGSVTVTGAIPGMGVPVGTLLTGSLLAFGFQPAGGNLFEFLFSVTGGSLATPAYYGAPGVGVFGVILNANGGGFNGNWGQSFNNNFGIPGFGFGVSDLAPIPAPATAALLLAGGLASARRRRAAVS